MSPNGSQRSTTKPRQLLGSLDKLKRSDVALLVFDSKSVGERHRNHEALADVEAFCLVLDCTFDLFEDASWESLPTSRDASLTLHLAVPLFHVLSFQPCQCRSASLEVLGSSCL